VDYVKDSKGDQHAQITNGERAVSWAPSDMERDDDGPPDSLPSVERLPTRSDVMAFRPIKPQDPDHQPVNPGIPSYLHQALEGVHFNTGRPIAHVGQFTLERGFTILSALDAVQRTRAAHKALVVAGRSLGKWDFSLTTRGKSPRLFLRHVSSVLQGEIATMARALGLEPSTVYALSIMAGLNELELPEDLSILIESELRAFRAGIEQRAAIAVELRASIGTTSPALRQVRVTDVLKGER
jgi:hypothetical protein